MLLLRQEGDRRKRGWGPQEELRSLQTPHWPPNSAPHFLICKVHPSTCVMCQELLATGFGP